MDHIYPLKLSYVPVSTIWGGNKLNSMFGKNTASEKIGETWELTVRDNRMCTILNGECKGLTLGDYIGEYGNDTVSDSYDGRQFPLLVKFIDASDRLSIQVHPDDDYASKVENDMGKTEMWYVVDAEPGAKLVYGLTEKFDKRTFVDELNNGNAEKVLKFTEAKKGDVFFIPSGLVHAIGKGIVIAEIQQNCDLTYRVYDYGRLDKNGNARELHTKKALDVMHVFSEEEINSIRYSKGKDGSDVIASCKYFTVRKIGVDGSKDQYVGKESFVALLCIEGEAEIVYKNISYHMASGDCWYIPAKAGDYQIKGNAELIHITL